MLDVQSVSQAPQCDPVPSALPLKKHNSRSITLQDVGQSEVGLKTRIKKYTKMIIRRMLCEISNRSIILIITTENNT